MKKPSVFLLLIFLSLPGVWLINSCTRQKCVKKAISIIPAPSLVEPGKGCFRITSSTRILIRGEDQLVSETADYLAGILEKVAGYKLQITGFTLHDNSKNNLSAGNAILLMLDDSLQSLGEEGYHLSIDNRSARISAFKPAGIFYGVQTLLQLLPEEVFSHQVIQGKGLIIPAVHISDQPRYSWRGMHLDVSRHFFSVDFIKQYIDLIAMHKMNVFHWHLTDDNGWRIEIKKYPLLMDISAWRADREDQPWDERTPPADGEKATYGGFYTQKDIREIVTYASRRHVLVVPEIEMPGHASEVFAAYPRFSCRGEKLFVRPGSYWPNNDILCAGNDSVFTFLEDVLTEVMELFPSPYIHIGGDEADKTQWKRCPKCQKRIRDENLKDENELQSYFIRRIEKFLNASGRRLIGWDEILEGGLAPEATVMSWRGFDGGIEAASQSHDVIMCPVSHCYFDYYQADPDFQPMAIGGFTSLKKVYLYEPTPPVLSREQARFVLGGQGNVWTEYIPTPEHAEYMVIPRMTALAEVLWSTGEKRNWEDFNSRLQKQFQRFDQMMVHYCKGSFAVEIQTKFDSVNHKVMAGLLSEQFNPEIRYTLDGSVPSKTSTLYTTPFGLDSTGWIQAAIFKGDSIMEKSTKKRFILHKAVGKQVTYESQWDYRYPAKSSFTLTDGIRGSDKHNDGYWQGFNGDDLVATIDLGKVDSIQLVRAGFLQRNQSWIFLPVKLVVAVSVDNLSWKEFYLENQVSPKAKENSVKDFEIRLNGIPARYVKVRAVNRGVCPAWHPGAGDKAWIFADEIMVH